jgi:hypothetical protein
MLRFIRMNKKKEILHHSKNYLIEIYDYLTETLKDYENELENDLS